MPSIREPGPIPLFRPSVAGGWTLVELTVAAALLMVGLLAMVPLFVRAARDVARAGAQSRAAGHGQNRLEGLAGPFSPALALAPEFFGLESRAWSPEPPAPPDRALWVRSGTLSYLGLGAFDDGRVEPEESLEPTSPDALLVLVEIETRGASSGEVRANLARLERVSR